MPPVCERKLGSARDKESWARLRACQRWGPAVRLGQAGQPNLPGGLVIPGLLTGVPFVGLPGEGVERH